MSDYVCTACDWEGEEDDLLACGHCNKTVCPVCGGKVITSEEAAENDRINRRDADKEDRRFGPC